MLALTCTVMVYLFYRTLRTDERIMLRVIAMWAAKLLTVGADMLVDQAVRAYFPFLDVGHLLLQWQFTEFATIP